MKIEKKLASPEIIRARFGRPWEEVARLTDRHTRAVQAWLSSRAPQAKRFNGLGVTASSTGLAVSLLNLALGSDFPAGTREQAIADEIETVKAFFIQRNVPWSWWMSPFPQPPDIGLRLEQQGLIFDPPPLPAMAAPLPATSPSIPAGINVWQAASQADLEAASQIRRIAFGFPEGVALTYFEDMATDWLNPTGPARLYLARLGNNGPPTAIGALIMGADLPGVYVMATLPEWGRQGLGRAILARILAQAAAESYSLIMLTAGEKGYPLYRQFGFEHIFDYNIFSLNPGFGE